jgi:hypothetical protein
MTPHLALCAMDVYTDSEDRQGQLVLYDGALVAVLVRLAGDEHEQDRGAWFLECGLGPLATVHEVFASLEDAEAWIAGKLVALAAAHQPEQRRA